jgi:hypothetical protein
MYSTWLFTFTEKETALHSAIMDSEEISDFLQSKSTKEEKQISFDNKNST